jgi:putative protease
VYISIPPITKGNLDNILREESKGLKNFGVDGLLLGNPGHIEMFKDSGLPLMGDYSFNIYNNESVAVAKELSLNGVTMSHELTLPMLKNLRSLGLDLEVTVYGRIPVFISEHCPIESSNFSSKVDTPCGLCQKRDFYIIDRKGAKFPVMGDPLSCKTTLLNKDIFNRPDYIEELEYSNCRNFRLYFYEESPVDIQREVNKFKELLANR